MAISILYQNNVTGAAHDVTTLITAAKWTTKRSGFPRFPDRDRDVDDAWRGTLAGFLS